MKQAVSVEHPFEPIYDARSTILILGTMPSVQSRAAGFYYGNPRNAFWRIMASVCECDVPNTDEEKRQMLLKHHIAIWDVCKSCEIRGSDDASIRNEVPTDIPGLLAKAPIRTIYANSQTAARQYNKLVKPQTNRDIIVLPSTSPAYCKMTEAEKTKIWKETIGAVPFLSASDECETRRQSGNSEPQA